MLLIEARNFNNIDEWSAKLSELDSVPYNKHLLINLLGGDWRKLYRPTFNEVFIKYDQQLQTKKG